jgi:hypothetical protein
MRAYWKQYGELPLDERMMKVLTSPIENSEARREAAVNLASFNWDHRMQTTTEFLSLRPGQESNPVVRKFSNPTVAEAILSSMDADLKTHDAKPQGPDLAASDHERDVMENAYLWALQQLGDKRIASELAKRIAEAGERRQRGPTERDLDDPKAFLTFVEYFRAGKVVLGASADKEFNRIIRALSDAKTPEADRALEALVNAAHPQHDLFLQKILTEESRWFGRGPWFSRPVCLTVLRQSLDDTTPTRARYSVEKNTLWRRFQIGGFGESAHPDLGRPLPAFLANPEDRQDVVPERICDLAAEKLGDLVAGLPLYHPIQKQADKRLTEFKAAFDRFGGHYRVMTPQELDGLSSTESQSSSTWTPAFLPNIPPLDRPATAADVKAGKAVFHLEGRGRRANLALPAVAVLKAEGQRSQPCQALIVQAEIGPNGQTTYGIITKHAVRAVGPRDLTDIKPFAELNK